MTIALRPEQLKLQSETFEAWNAGERNVLDVLPTGGGKSIIVSDTVRIFDDNNDYSLVAAHRKELVGQMSLHIARQGVRHRIIAPDNVVRQIMAEHRRELDGQCFINPSARCAVAGIDTIVARESQLREWLRMIRLYVTDEAHHVLKENKWGKGMSFCPNAFGLGVTASPRRADGKGLGAATDGLFHRMNIGPSMRDLINMGNLCDYEIVCPPSDFDIDLPVGPSGDHSTAQMKAASEKSKIVGDVVENYIKHAYGKRAVAFATDVATATKMAAQFNLFGIPAAAISGDTDSIVRDDMIRRLRDGRLWVLVNVDLLGEGFDLPAIECVIMARPTASLAVYLQQFGRALRILAGKLYGLVIDHVSNIKKHGFPDRPHAWSLAPREKRGKSRPDDPELVPTIVCQWCTKPYEAIHAKCPHCDKAPEIIPGVGGRSAIEQVMGDLTRLDAETLARMRSAAELDSPTDKASQAAWVAGKAAGAGMYNRQLERIQAQERLKESLAQWAGYQRWKGRQDAEIHMRFFHATGLDVLSALSGERTKSEFEDLAQRVSEWLPKN